MLTNEQKIEPSDQSDPFTKGCSGVITRDRSCERREQCGRFVAWPAHDTPFNLCWFPGTDNFKPRAGATPAAPVPALPVAPQLDLFA